MTGKNLEEWKALYRKYREFTMIWEPRFWDNLELARRYHVPGSAVLECGVWKGGMIAAIAEALQDPNAVFHLFDSFEGLPEVEEIDGEAARAWQEDTEGEEYHDNCRAEQKEAEMAMEKAGAIQSQIHPGWFEDTFPKVQLDRGISILRLDADWYEGTFACLERWFDEVIPGGIIILDDYLTWDGCSRAVHDFLAAGKRSEKIRNTAWEVVYLVKE